MQKDNNKKNYANMVLAKKKKKIPKKVQKLQQI